MTAKWKSGHNSGIRTAWQMYFTHDNIDALRAKKAIEIVRVNLLLRYSWYINNFVAEMQLWDLDRLLHLLSQWHLLLHRNKDVYHCIKVLSLRSHHCLVVLCQLVLKRLHEQDETVSSI